MKNFTFLIKTIIILIIILVEQNGFAQSPESMSYQAIIRNSGNSVITNQPVGVRVSILKNSATGTEVFKEFFSPNPTTNANGLLSLQIGSGTVLTGSFAGIDWSAGPYFIKTEIDPSGGTNYSVISTSQLMSVPYALYAKTAGNSSGASSWTTSGTDIYNTNTGNVGIGTNTPVTKLSVKAKADGTGISQVSPDGAVNIGFYTHTNGAYVQTNSDHDLNFATTNSTAKMTLQKTTGNFGIGTVTPTEKLEVNGKTKTTNLQVTNGAGAGKVLTSDANGNGSWTQVMRNDVLSIGPFSFVSNFGGHYLNTIKAFFPTNVNNGNLIAQIHLPNSAVISGNITVYFLDNSAGDYSISLIRAGQGGGFPETLFSFNTSGTNTAVQTRQMPISTPMTIDNVTYNYYIGMGGDFLNGDGICGVKIPYSYPVNN
ncbi:hypothetical protein [Flavobacterium microcysteis]